MRTAAFLSAMSWTCRTCVVSYRYLTVRPTSKHCCVVCFACTRHLVRRGGGGWGLQKWSCIAEYRKNKWNSKRSKSTDLVLAIGVGSFYMTKECAMNCLAVHSTLFLVFSDDTELTTPPSGKCENWLGPGETIQKCAFYRETNTIYMVVYFALVPAVFRGVCDVFPCVVNTSPRFWRFGFVCQIDLQRDVWHLPRGLQFQHCSATLRSRTTLSTEILVTESYIPISIIMLLYWTLTLFWHEIVAVLCGVCWHFASACNK